MKQGATVDDVRGIVRRDNVGRFQLDEVGGNYRVRAVQGHSAKSGVRPENVLPQVWPEDLPEFLFHGTFLDRQDSIVQRGLQCGAGLSATGDPTCTGRRALGSPGDHSGACTFVRGRTSSLW